MAEIQRIGVTRRWSDAVIHGDTVYFVEVPESTEAGIDQQVKEVLDSIDARLTAVGSARTKLLQVMIYLTDMRYIDALNAQWDAWVPEGHAPARACVKAELAHPGYKIEMVITAAR